ncbi:hypothetical protein EJ06DRAFT_528798 [Trichodelitschia bisporula]|uniref:Polarized growth protein Boi2 n=1 Tax=Trichodelitschia bisporula TaxID=703511 RepID=A0A6G1I026_9PEZI|nr:hypothetical protein EJ06DRAFT_528798 [Trichodelitschia bisporula]
MLTDADNFKARSGDELTLRKGDRIELIERDDDFGDGWFLGRHVQRGTTGLFPEVYTTPEPKPTNPPTSQPPLHQATSSLHSVETNGSEVRPLGSMDSSLGSVPSPEQLRIASSMENTSPVPPSNPVTPPSVSTIRRTPPTSTAHRSISLSNGTHQNSPVMNETLSVIEEHITDMNTPRHSILIPEGLALPNDDNFTSRLDRRLSYINGNETDEEEAGILTDNEVRIWTPEQVAAYLDEVGADKQHCRVFRDQEITGEVLLGMDQGSLMLKEFELGSIGKRLALWQKIKALQDEVKNGRKTPRPGSEYSNATHDTGRARSTSFGTVLPRIPSLMEGSRTPSRQHTHPRGVNESVSSLPPIMDSPHMTHSPRPSAASIRDFNNSRRHSSIDCTSQTDDQSRASTALTAHTHHTHTKQGSFDQTWTMRAAPGEETSIAGILHSPRADSPHSQANAPEVRLSVVNSIDLDRGYFSGNEVENRKARNVLKKRTAETTHMRAPSDGYNNRRLSHVFRQKRTGSTDSIHDISTPMSPAAHMYYNTSKPGVRATSVPQFGKPLKQTSQITPTVTKLDYTASPSSDALAAPPSETSSIDHPGPSPAHKSLFSRTRATGLRAISDAITGDEKARIQVSARRSPVKEAAPQASSRTGSSTPSINSKSIDIDENSVSSLIKGTSTGGSGRRHTASQPKRKSKKDTSAYRHGLQKKSPKEQMIGCDYSGWMKKKSSHLMTTWKPRLFVLRGCRLSYYYSEEDTEEQGVIDIAGHRVLSANNDRITGLHATFTGAASSPSSPQNAQIETTASLDAVKAAGVEKEDASGMFIFKLLPPRPGGHGVNFTKPTVHYFAVDNVQQGRLWMAALVKATINRKNGEVISTYAHKTISLQKAKEMRQRPPALMEPEDSEPAKSDKSDDEKKGLAIELESIKKVDDDLNAGPGAEKTSSNTDLTTLVHVPTGSIDVNNILGSATAV